jgi:hypothetical protein
LTQNNSAMIRKTGQQIYICSPLHTLSNWTMILLKYPRSLVNGKSTNMVVCSLWCKSSNSCPMEALNWRMFKLAVGFAWSYPST